MTFPVPGQTKQLRVLQWRPHIRGAGPLRVQIPARARRGAARVAAGA